MKIAVFLPNWIGDVVMATPAVRAVREQFAAAEIVGVCKPYVAEVLEGSPHFDRIDLLDSRGPGSHRWFSVARRLRRDRPDLALLFPNSFRSAITAWFGGSRRIVGFNRYARGWMLTDSLNAKRGLDGKYLPSPIIDDYNRLAVAAGAAPNRRMELCTTPRDEIAADAVLARLGLSAARELVLLNPGAAFGAAKHWPVEHFARLASEFAERRGSHVLVLCGPKERDMARWIVSLAGNTAVVSLADAELSIGLTKALVRRCDLLVTTDSGPRHFAAAFDRPVVSLFGPTHIAWTETYFEKAIHLRKQVPCGPCQQRTCSTDHRCMKDLSPEEVFAAATSVLSGGRMYSSRGA